MKSNQPILCHRPLHVKEGERERLKVGEKERKEGRKGTEEARQEEWALPVASGSLHQVPMESRAAPALGPREGQAGPASVVS